MHCIFGFHPPKIVLGKVKNLNHLMSGKTVYQLKKKSLLKIAGPQIYMTKKKLIGKELLQSNVAQPIVGSINISFGIHQKLLYKTIISPTGHSALF